MKLQESKISSTIAMILILTASAFVASFPAANAHTPPWSVSTYAYLNVEPNPIGIGQTVQVTFWLDKVPPTANTIWGDRWNLTVTVTKPDGTTQTLGPFRSDDVGGSYTAFAPAQVGTYYFQMSFAGQTLVNANPAPGVPSVSVGDFYQASTSAKVALTVQQQPITHWPVTPLPTGYWARPINIMNAEWRSIAGDWLLSGYDAAGNRYNPFTTAPDSAHVVWTYQVAPGGVVGGNYNDANYYTGLTYESKFNSPFIMYGNLYFNLPLSTSAGSGGAVCINLHTGQQLWWQNNTRLSFGQELDYQSPNQFGTIPYLWSTGATYNCYDPYTGQWLFSLGNASTGSTTYGPGGELLVYILDGTNNWLAMWNSTQAIMYYQQPGVLAGGNVWQWRPLMLRTMDWRQGLQWNVTIPSYKDPGTQSIKLLTPDVILATSGILFSAPQNWQMEIGYSTKDGHQMWVQNRTTPLGSTTWALIGPGANGVYTEFYESTTQWQGFSLTTGQKLWGPTDPYPRAFGMYSWQASIAYGMLLAIDFGGYLHAYDIQTGTHLWDFFAGNSGLETAYGAWPLNNPPPVSADGKIFVSAGHGYNPPVFKGAKMYCVNATNGNLLWSLLGFHTYNGILVADGFLVAYNSYDAQIYCYGKGRTATTVSASPKVSALGNNVLIEGTVTDQSPGQTCLGVPAAGTPAISDASMSPWMEYLYEQQPKPTNATGVPVTLTAIDPNGNMQNIGTVTSNILGNYAIAWTPPVPGVYTITATFSGSNSYFSSQAGTAIDVSKAPVAQASVATPAPAATPPPTVTTTPSPTASPQVTATPAPAPSSAGVPTTYIVIAVVAIIVVVAAAAIALRRRK